MNGASRVHTLNCLTSKIPQRYRSLCLYVFFLLEFDTVFVSKFRVSSKCLFFLSFSVPEYFQFFAIIPSKESRKKSPGHKFDIFILKSTRKKHIQAIMMLQSGLRSSCSWFKTYFQTCIRIYTQYKSSQLFYVHWIIL